MQTDKLSLTGQLLPDDIEMAVEVFNAKVIEVGEMESPDSTG